MADAETILRNLEKEFDLYHDIIRDEIRKGNQSEALLWYNDLLKQRAYWLEDARKSTKMSSQDFGRGTQVLIDTGKSKGLARMRVDCLNRVIAPIESEFRKKGWL
jgi:hypothetical protein